MKNIFLLLFLLTFFNSVVAKEFNSEKEIRKFSDAMIAKVVSGEYQAAFDDAKPYWPLPEVEIDSIVNQLNLQSGIIGQRFGKSLGFEYIKEERAGNSLIRLYYLHKYEKHAMYWRLDFYKPEKKWKINSLASFDNLEPLYD